MLLHKSYLRYVPEEIDRWGEDPLYMQLAAILRAQIQSGELRPGQQLPSESSMHKEYGLARNTIRQAIKVLREEGLVITRQQRGTIVRPQQH